jgi:hypothetical protein
VGIGVSVAIVLAAVAIRGWFRWFWIASLVVILGFTTLSSVAIQGIEENDTRAEALERVTAYGFMVCSPAESRATGIDVLPALFTSGTVGDPRRAGQKGT